MVRVLHTLAGLLSLAAAAAASPYWISYEGNGYPENEGWTRHAYEGGAVRSLADGQFITDGTGNLGIVDFYDRRRPEGVNPAPGETLVMEWRVRVESNTSYVDQSIGIFTDDRRAVAFNLGVDRAQCAFNTPPTYVYYTPHVAHTFRLTSTDLNVYDLYIDGQFAQHGSFFLYAVESSRLVWGDGNGSAPTWATWDFVRFGVIPEPSSLVAVLIVLLGFRQKRSHVASGKEVYANDYCTTQHNGRRSGPRAGAQ